MKRRYTMTGLLVVVLLLSGIAALLLGAADISRGAILKFLFTMHGLTGVEQDILLRIRLPRILLAGLAGAVLAYAGVVFQALLRNSLADPYIIGVSSGSALGAVIALSFGVGSTLLGFSTVPFFAFIGGIISLVIVYRLAKTGAVLQAHTMLLTGVVVNSFFSAIIMFILSISSADRLQEIMFWLMGNLRFIAFGRLALVAGCSLVGMIVIFIYAADIDLLSLGDESAMQLGVDVVQVKRILFIATALIVSTVVSVSGLIGFVGLIIPHIVRLLTGPRHRVLLPASALAGASFLIISDTIARTVLNPIEIPVGVVTAFLGGPFFLYLLRSKRKSML